MREFASRRVYPFEKNESPLVSLILLLLGAIETQREVLRVTIDEY